MSFPSAERPPSVRPRSIALLAVVWGVVTSLHARAGGTARPSVARIATSDPLAHGDPSADPWRTAWSPRWRRAGLDRLEIPACGAPRVSGARTLRHSRCAAGGVLAR